MAKKRDSEHRKAWLRAYHKKYQAREGVMPEELRAPGQFAAPVPIAPELLEAAARAIAAADLPELEGYDPDAPDDPGDEDPYPDWSEATTRVISGPLGDKNFPGYRAETWQGAKAHARDVAGTAGVKLYKFWTVPGRWFARLGRTK